MYSFDFFLQKKADFKKKSAMFYMLRAVSIKKRVNVFPCSFAFCSIICFSSGEMRIEIFIDFFPIPLVFLPEPSRFPPLVFVFTVSIKTPTK